MSSDQQHTPMPDIAALDKQVHDLLAMFRFNVASHFHVTPTHLKFLNVRDTIDEFEKMIQVIENMYTHTEKTLQNFVTEHKEMDFCTNNALEKTSGRARDSELFKKSFAG